MSFLSNFLRGFGRRSNRLHSDWEIKPFIPWHRKPSVLFSFVVLATSIIGSYFYLNYVLYHTRQELTKITKEYKELRQKHISTKTAKIKLQRKLEVAQQSQQEIQSNLLQLHEQSQDLTEQVDLYKRIMSTNRSSESIAIENLQLRVLDADNQSNNEYMISWVLLQASKKRSLQQGGLDLKIAGKLGDNDKKFNYSQVAVDNKKRLDYQFREFQQFNKKIKLPADFKIENITIEVQDNKTKLSKSKTFDTTILGRQTHVAQAQDTIRRS